jgi:cell shape-determining protein MreC
MTRNYCALYKKAAEENETYKDKAAEWEQKLKEICENPAFPAQNAQYGEYFQNSVR